MSAVNEWNKALSYMGTSQRVKVILDNDDPNAYVIGIIKSLNDYGEVVVIEATTGLPCYCWPLIRVEEVD